MVPARHAPTAPTRLRVAPAGPPPHLQPTAIPAAATATRQIHARPQSSGPQPARAAPPLARKAASPRLQLVPAASHSPPASESSSASYARSIRNSKTGEEKAAAAAAQVVPGSGELVIFGSHAKKPFLVVGVVSDDGSKLKHKVDLKLKRSTLCHDIGVTLKYNIIIDIPLTIDIGRLTAGGQ
ncbi:hypothetical protein ZWY2020_015275 [Hordeum vulgare]|nr:hypothetical protein ZWY2020_015275 [Hordeum vulgare]